MPSLKILLGSENYLVLSGNLGFLRVYAVRSAKIYIVLECFMYYPLTNISKKRQNEEVGHVIFHTLREIVKCRVFFFVENFNSGGTFFENFN